MSAQAIFFSAIAAVCWGAGAIFDKLVIRHLDPTVAFFVRFYLLFLIVFPFLVRGWYQHKAAMIEAPRVVPAYLMLSVLFYAVGMFVYYHALARAEASKVVPFTSVYPMVTFGLSLAFLGEGFTWGKLVGTVMVVTGTVVLAR